MEVNSEEKQFEQAIHTSKLILKYLQGKLSDSEQQELDVWIDQNESNRETFSALTNPASLNAGLHEFHTYNTEAARKKLFRKLFATTTDEYP
jgi:hypothetical protein